MNKRKEISPTVDKPASKIRNITKSPLHMKPEMDSGTECDIGSPTNIRNMLLERITNLTTSIDPQDLRDKVHLDKKPRDWVPELAQYLETKWQNEIKNVTEFFGTVTAKLANDLVQAKQEIRDLKIQMSQQTSINAHLRHQQTEADMYEKRLNLIFTGIDESPQENLGNWFNDLCENTLKLDDSIELNDIMRLGRVRHDDRIPTRKRPILVKLAYMKDKQKIMKERRNLTDTGIFMNEDYPVEVQKARRKLIPIAKEIRRHSYKAYLNKDTLSVHGNGKFGPIHLESLHANDLDRLPIELRDGSRWFDDSIYFFGESCPASNFKECNFEYKDAIYPNIEKVIFEECADFFDDKRTLKEIRQMSDPRQIKWKGKGIKGYNVERWKPEIKKRILPALVQKFSQNQTLKNWLKATGSRTLIEAAGENEKVWGCGVHLNDDEINECDKQGLNYQGEMLMEVRHQLFGTPAAVQITETEIPLSQGFSTSIDTDTKF